MAERLGNMEPIKTEEKERNGTGEFKSSLHLDTYYQGFHIRIIEADPAEYERTNALIANAKKRIDAMVAQGFEPSWNPDTNRRVTAKQETEVYKSPESTAPICQVHNTPMTWKTGVSQRTGKPYAFWTCSGRMQDGSFCSYKPPKA